MRDIRIYRRLKELWQVGFARAASGAGALTDLATPRDRRLRVDCIGECGLRAGRREVGVG